jgi:hypothetical protein
MPDREVPLVTPAMLDVGEAAVIDGLNQGLPPRIIAGVVYRKMRETKRPVGRPRTLDEGVRAQMRAELASGISRQEVRRRHKASGWIINALVKELEDKRSCSL